jgi:hypothetical protein
VKLVGVPAFDAWLGDFDDADAANASWAAFLATPRGSEDVTQPLDR